MTTARTATPSTARAINDRLALDLLLGHGPLTATELRALTGLSRPTVADLLERLQRGGLVAIVGSAASSAVGPTPASTGCAPTAPTWPASTCARSASRSLSPTSPGGRWPAPRCRSTPPTRPVRPGFADQVLRTLLATAREAGARELHTVAVGAPGLVDPASGALSTTSRLHHWHAELVATLRAGLSGRLLLENEANLAGIAEHRLGAATDRDTFVLLWLGHGTGAAVVLDGRLRRGSSGGTGEIGFLPVPGTGSLPGMRSCDGASTAWPAARRSARWPARTACRWVTARAVGRPPRRRCSPRSRPGRPASRSWTSWPTGSCSASRRSA